MWDIATKSYVARTGSLPTPRKRSNALLLLPIARSFPYFLLSRKIEKERDRRFSRMDESCCYGLGMPLSRFDGASYDEGRTVVVVVAEK